MDHAKVIRIHAYPHLYGIDHTRLPTETDDKGQHLCNVGHAKGLTGIDGNGRHLYSASQRSRVSVASVVRRKPRKLRQRGLGGPARSYPTLVYAIRSLCAKPGSLS